MKLNKKIMLLGVAAVAGVSAFGLTSCAEKIVTGTYDLKVWAPEEALELTEKQVKDFEKQTEGLTINLTIEKVGEGDAATSMVTDVENGADIFFFAQDQLARLVEARALAKVSPNIQKWIAENNVGAANDASKFAGDTYCFPLTADNGFFMYYDKSVISEANLDSLEKLIAECESKERLFSFELENAWYNAAFFFATGCKSEWTQGADKNWTANDTYKSDAGVIAVKGMQKLVKSSVYNNSSNAPDSFAKSGKQKSAIVVSGTWNAAKTKEVLGDNYGATDLPSFTVDNKTYQLGSFFGCKLLGTKPQTDSNKATLVRQLAQYLTGEKGQTERFETLNWGPSNKAAAANEKVKSDIALSAMALQASHKETLPQGQYPGAWWDIAKAITTSAKSASTDAEINEALNTYKTAIDKIVAKKYVPFSERTYTLAGTYGTNEWNAAAGVQLTKETSGNKWTSAAVTFKANDEFKVVGQNEYWYGFTANTTDTNLEDAGGNIKVKTAGTYKVVFEVLSTNSDGEPATWSVSLVPAN